jgi:hypothetical protein
MAGEQQGVASVTPPGLVDPTKLGPDPRLFHVDENGVGWPHVIGLGTKPLAEDTVLEGVIMQPGQVVPEGGWVLKDGTQLAAGTVLTAAVQLKPEILKKGTPIVQHGSRTNAQHLESAIECLEHAGELFKNAIAGVIASLTRHTSAANVDPSKASLDQHAETVGQTRKTVEDALKRLATVGG